jgi:hypothetical protein
MRSLSLALVFATSCAGLTACGKPEDDLSRLWRQKAQTSAQLPATASVAATEAR